MNKKSKKKLILLELNEVNFDMVREYINIQPNRFMSLNKILSETNIRTTSEENYRHLEPWIQWASVHTGMTYAEHGIFRLGDVIRSKQPQIFEVLEKFGYQVGAISAMNVENRLKNPAYFIPDPWTQTSPDRSWWSRILSESISQAVNDNAQSKITVKSYFQILFAWIRFAKLKNYKKYLKLIFASFKKPWFKPLVLDLLLYDVHMSLFNKKKPDFSTIFLNAGAHIQHHYLFNALPIKEKTSIRNPNWYVENNQDPIADVLDLYNSIVEDILKQKNVEILLSTGLTQKPYDRLKFYYRLKDHSDFLKKLNIMYRNVYPRMTRDFLVTFKSPEQAISAEKKLSSLQVGIHGQKLFNEIDNRGDSLFVTLTYPDEITDSTTFGLHGNEMQLKKEVSFVAIKNGMHEGTGFAFFTAGIAKYAPKDYSHVSLLNQSILDFFHVH